MMISFDLDDTLFVSETEFVVEPKLRFPFERIRKRNHPGQ